MRLSEKRSADSFCCSLMIEHDVCLSSCPQLDKIAGTELAGLAVKDFFSADSFQIISRAISGGYTVLFYSRFKDRMDSFYTGLWPENGRWRLAVLLDCAEFPVSAARLNNMGCQIKDQLSFFFGALNLLSRSIKSGDEARASSHLSLIMQNSYRLERLTGNLIWLTSPENAPPFSPVLGDISLACRGIFESCEVHLERMQSTISFSAPPAPIYTCFDQTDLEHIIFNLISNSIKHNPPGVKVNLSVEKERGSAVITVSDNGAGIDPELIKPIFIPDTCDDRPGGITGMGLPLVHKSARRHNGSVCILTRPGATEVSVDLPITESYESPAKLRHSPVDYAGGLDHTLIELSDVLAPDEFVDL